MTKADEQLRAMAMDLAKDSIVTKALAKFLAQVVEEAVQSGKDELAEALRVERESQQEFRLQNDREWKAKVDHAKAQAKMWRADAFTAAADIAERYGATDAARDIRIMSGMEA